VEKTVNDTLEGIWKKVVVAYMNIFTQPLPGMAEGNHRELIRIADLQAIK
jgi:hypothetical protein